MTDEPTDDDLLPDDPVPEPDARPMGNRPVGRTVRVGCIILGVIGILALFLGVSTATDPAKARCGQARTILENDGDVEDAGDIECDDAIAQALALHEDDEDAAELPNESTIRTFAFMFTVVGMVQTVGAVLTARTRKKSFRIVALVGAGLGLVVIVPTLGIFGLLPLGFVVYAIFFSADARAVFGEPSGPRMFRPRT